MSDDLHFVDTHVHMLCMDGVVTEEDILKNDLGDNSVLMWPNECVVPTEYFAFTHLIDNLYKCNCYLIDASIKINKKLIDMQFHFRDLDGVGWYGVDDTFYNSLTDNFSQKLGIPNPVKNIYKGTSLAEVFNCAILVDEWSDRDGRGSCSLDFKSYSKVVKITDKAQRLFETTALEDFVKECIEKGKKSGHS